MTRILRILAPNAGPFTLDGTNTWIVGQDPAIVIDPGPDDPSHLLGVLDEAGPVASIVLTHHHPDHSPGAGRLAEASGAAVHAWRPEDDERSLADHPEVEAGEVRLVAVHTPGHTPDHTAFFLEDRRALFTGDAVLGRGTSIVNPPEGDMATYERSLRTMRDLQPSILYPGHGPTVFDARGKLDEYIGHRRRREREVLKALEEGKGTPEEMVPGIYEGEVPASMYPAAARSVEAHLLKLEREGRAARAGGRWVVATPRPCERCGRPALPGSRYCRRCGMAVLQEGPRRGTDRG